MDGLGLVGSSLLDFANHSAGAFVDRKRQPRASDSAASGNARFLRGDNTSARCSNL